MKVIESSSAILAKAMQNIPLETTIRVSLEMHDYDNWSNGDYSGDADKYTPIVIEHINRVMSEYKEQLLAKLESVERLDVEDLIKFIKEAKK